MSPIAFMSHAHYMSNMTVAFMSRHECECRVYASYINDMYDMLSDALMNLEILIEIYKRTSI